MIREEFDEFIYKRCDSILQQDEIYKELNEDILLIESEFKKHLSPKQKKIYNQLEELIMRSIVHSQVCIYKSNLSYNVQMSNSNTPLTPL